MRRRLLLGLGGVLSVAGLALAVGPGVGGLPSADDAVVLLVGVATVGAGALVLRAETRGADGPGDAVVAVEPESLAPLSVPGDDLADTFDRARAGDARSREAVRERLRTAAVSVVRRRRGCSSRRARHLVDRGEWTDGPHAAAFLAGRGHRTPPDLPSGVDSPFVHRAGRTVDTIVALADGEEQA